MFITLLSIISFSAMAGIRDIGNGGDAIVLEFTTYAHQVLKDIQVDAYAEFPEFKASDLANAIQKTQVVSLEKTILNGVEKDAINYPTLFKIEVSRSRWLTQTNSPEKVRALVLHEYLGIMNIDDHDYRISGRLIDYYLQFKKRIARLELLGRTYITSQEDASTQGLLNLENSTLTFNGIIEGVTQKCSGNYIFDYNQQVLKSELNCAGKRTELSLTFWNSDVVDFLRGNLISVGLSFKQSSGKKQINYNQVIDAKHL